MKKLLLLSLSMIISPVVFCGWEPVAKIPYSIEKPRLDGMITRSEWQDAAVINNICNCGTRTLPANPTTFYLKYDDQYLYVAAECQETDPSYPEAYSRPWDDLLFRNDDAVQVVLGVADPAVAVRGKMYVGGYTGALDGDLTAADFYYQFTVNAIGVKQRTFNETPLKKAGFEAVVKTEPGKRWTAEMKIPFAICGLKNLTGKTIFANLFRFRPPDMAGWTLPAFWGYSSMPLGKFQFLPLTENSQRKIESTSMLVQNAEKVRKSCRVDIQYSPLSGAIIGQATLSGKWPELYGILEVSGFPPQKQKLDHLTIVDHDRVSLEDAPRYAYVLRELKLGDQPARKATFKVVDGNDKIVAQTSTDCPAAKAPEWLGTQAGIAYVHDKVPAPWTSPAVSNRQIALLDKTISIDQYALPDSIMFKDKNEELLAGSAVIKIKANGETLKFTGTALQVKQDKAEARAEATLQNNAVTLETKSRIEADGFMEIKFRLQHILPQNVDSVAVEIPLKKENARLLMHGQQVQKAAALTGNGFRDRADSLWVGTYDKGLQFSYDTDTFISSKLRQQLQLKEEKDRTLLVINFCDGKKQFKEGMIFRFFLQPTPTKPMPAERTRSWVTWQWENWSEWHGYPDLNKIPDVKKHVAETKQQGKISVLYNCQGLQDNAPYYQEFNSDLIMMPLWKYYRCHNHDCFATCKRGPEGDLQLWGYDRLVKETGIGGIVSDGLMPAWGCSNPAHANGCGRPQKVEWNSDLSSRVVAQRDFIKRLRGLFTDAGRPFCFVAHTGGAIDVNTMSFADAYFEGEQMARFRNGYYPAEAIFAAGYSGYPWGWRTQFWAKDWRNLKGIASSLAYSLLFNMEMGESPNIDQPGYDLTIYQDFSGAQTEFIPFWTHNQYTQLKSGHSLSSLWKNPDKAMVVISNLQYETDAFKLDFSKLFPGKKLKLTDVLRHQNVKADGTLLVGELEPYSCLVIHFEPENATVVSQKLKTSTMNESDWQVNIGAPGVSKSVGNGYLTIQGKPYQAAAMANLGPLTLDDEATVRLSVIPKTRFAIRIGSSRLVNDGGRWFFGGNNQNDGDSIANPYLPLGAGQSHTLDLTVKHGILNLYWDNTALVWNKPFKPSATERQIILETWHDDPLSFKTVSFCNYYEPLKLTAGKFSVKNWSTADWQVNALKQELNKKLDNGKTGISFTSEPYKGQASANFQPSFGRDLYVDLNIKLPSRFIFQLGPTQITYGGSWTGWGWYTNGLIEKYGNGQLFPNVPLYPQEFKQLQISMNDGVLDVLFDGKVVLKSLPCEMPVAGNRFSIITWHNEPLEFSINEISTQPRQIVTKEKLHPVK